VLAMSTDLVAPGAQRRRFADYLHCLAQAAKHLDRATPLKLYCTGLLLPGERKSVEPLAARLAPDNVRQTHQSLHHVVAHARGRTKTFWKWCATTLYPRCSGEVRWKPGSWMTQAW
jgi:hypothetical protein